MNSRSSAGRNVLNNGRDDKTLSSTVDGEAGAGHLAAPRHAGAAADIPVGAMNAAIRSITVLARAATSLRKQSITANAAGEKSDCSTWKRS